jgi:hypothetical protein
MYTYICIFILNEYMLNILNVFIIIIYVMKMINCYHICRYLPESDGDRGILYGVAIVRVQGPDEYVHAFPEYVTEKEISVLQSQSSDTTDPKVPIINTSASTPTSLTMTTVPAQVQGASTILPPNEAAGGLGIGVSPRVGIPVSFSMGGAGPPNAAGVRLPLTPVGVSAHHVMGAVPPTAPVITAGVPHPTPMISTPLVPTPASLVPVPAALSETIKKVAQFCAQNGATTITMLKKKDGAMNVMPFLFEGQLGYDEFLMTLKGILGMASNNANSSSSVVPPPVPPPSRK